MSSALISSKELEIGAALLAWTKTYLMGEQTKINRPCGSQAVCPFVEASLRTNALYMAFHSEIMGREIEPIIELVRSYSSAFIGPCGDPEGARNPYKALLIVFPRLLATNYTRLDVVQERAKDQMVEKGLMIGQFHPQCRTPAVHNLAWRGVSVAPYPFIAMRNMVVHDILFLNSRRNWFWAYYKRYGAKLEKPNAATTHSSYLVETYKDAKAKFVGPE
jgi:heptaprenyl diphosphate synthase